MISFFSLYIPTMIFVTLTIKMTTIRMMEETVRVRKGQIVMKAMAENNMSPMLSSIDPSFDTV